MSDDMPSAGSITVRDVRKPEPVEELRNDSDMPRAVFVEGIGMQILMPGESVDTVRVLR